MKIYDPIRRNLIILKGNDRSRLYCILHTRFKINGCDNIITIEESTKFKGLFLVFGNYNSFHIGKNCLFGNCTMRADGNHNSIIIGNNTTYEGGVLNAIDHTRIKIGDDCMLSYGINIMSSDGHPIFIEGKNIKYIRYNRSKNISIGNHVWIGMNVQVLKGVSIPDNCVVGAGSLVNKPFDERNCIIAGHPAKLIKQKIYWKRCF